MAEDDTSGKTIVYDFGDGAGPVPAHRHPRGGGWVADTASVSMQATVTEGASVFGKARVTGPAEIYGYAQVCDSATVQVHAKVGGNVCVRGAAAIAGDIRLSGTRVYEGEEKIDEEYILGLRGPSQPTANCRILTKPGLTAHFDADITWLAFTVTQFHACGQTYLYHLTSLDNLASIFRYGLLPRNCINGFQDIANEAVNQRRQAIRFKTVGWKSAHDCVPMFFVTDTPMIHSLGPQSRQLAWLEIDIERLVSTRAHLVFTDGNLAAIRSTAYWSVKFLKCLNWKVIRSTGFPKGATDEALKEWKRIKAAEVLAYPFVPVSAIRSILVACDVQAECARDALRAIPNTTPVHVRPRSFPGEYSGR